MFEPFGMGCHRQRSMLLGLRWIFFGLAGGLHLFTIFWPLMPTLTEPIHANTSIRTQHRTKTALSDNLEAAASRAQVLVDNILFLDLELHEHVGAQPSMGFLAFGTAWFCVAVHAKERRLRRSFELQRCCSSSPLRRHLAHQWNPRPAEMFVKFGRSVGLRMYYR